MPRRNRSAASALARCNLQAMDWGLLQRADGSSTNTRWWHVIYHHLSQLSNNVMCWRSLDVLVNKLLLSAMCPVAKFMHS